MIMQKKAERRRRRREEARVAAAHAHAEEHEETQVMEHAPKENASSLLSQGVAEVPAKHSADHVSQYQEFPLKQHHQSSFAGKNASQSQLDVMAILFPHPLPLTVSCVPFNLFSKLPLLL